jgi:addiction module RelB/DinJ family antitoxin
MTAVNINILADRELESQTQSVLADLGMDMSTAFNAFLTQVVDKKALPFKTDEPKSVTGKIPRLELRSCTEVCLSDNFDEQQEIVQKTSYLIPPDLTKTPQPGCMKGKIWMADDFDAPMEEFAEYM